MPDDQNIMELQKAVAPLASRFGVERMYLFGSRARGDHRADSDYDFLISKGRVQSLFTNAALWQALEDTLQAPVDLVTDTSSDTELIRQARKDAILIVLLES
jgi:predicted nucleotidyltransferase